MQVNEREEIDEELKWNREEMFSSWEEWEKELERVEEKVDEFGENEGKISESLETLLETLKKRDEVSRSLDDLITFSRMAFHEDMRQAEVKNRLSKAESLRTDFQKTKSILEPEILKWSREEVIQYLEEKGLKDEYGHEIDDIFRMEEHILSKEIEESLSSMQEVFSASSDTYSVFMNADLDFPEVKKDGEKVEISLSNFTKLQKDSDREFRRKVYEKFYDTISSYENTIGSTIQKEVKKNVRLAELRNYESARKASLDSDNIPVSIYDRLNRKVNQNTDLLERFIELKRKANEIEDFSYRDIYMPLTDEESKIEYSEARKKVIKALDPLGDQYSSIVKEGFENRWVDIYENKGKKAGAYSGGTYDSDPYILMNYQENIDSVYTLAHEIGHSVHSYLNCENQSYSHSKYSIFVAEMASTTNEVLLTESLLKNSDDRRFKLRVLGHFLENFRNTFYRQAMFSQLEQFIHEKVEEEGSVSHMEISERYGDLKSNLYPGIGMDDRIKNEWMRIPHFYYNFYVFQYSTGLTAGIDFAEQILDGENKSYIEMLKKGGSEYPVEMVREAGVDLDSDKPYDRALNVFEDYLERAEKLL